MADRRRVAAREAVPRIDGPALLDEPFERSGLAAATLLRRVGRRFGWTTVRDLLFHLPRRYDDLRELSKLADLRDIEEGEVVSATVGIRDLRVEPGFRRKIQRTVASVFDDTGDAQAVWFGRRFIERRLKVGDTVVMSGKIRHRGWVTSFDNPEFQHEDAEGAVLHAGRIVPVYRLSAGLTAARLRIAIREALDRAGTAYPEYLPDEIRHAEGLVPIGRAMESAHYPDSFEARDEALRRLAFDELFALQLGMVARRRERARTSAPSLAIDDASDISIRETLISGIAARAERDVQAD